MSDEKPKRKLGLVDLQAHLAQPAVDVAKTVQDIGTDIGDDVFPDLESRAYEVIDIRPQDETPTWLINLLTIISHSVSLVETALNAVLLGEFGRPLGKDREIILIIRERQQ